MYTDLDGVLVGEEVDDLERMCDNANGQKLLAVVAALHHQANIHSNTRPATASEAVRPLRRAYNAHLSTNRSTMGI